MPVLILCHVRLVQSSESEQEGIYLRSMLPVLIPNLWLLLKTTFFKTTIKCTFQRDAFLMEIQIKGVKKGIEGTCSR